MTLIDGLSAEKHCRMSSALSTARTLLTCVLLRLGAMPLPFGKAASVRGSRFPWGDHIACRRSESTVRTLWPNKRLGFADVKREQRAGYSAIERARAPAIRGYAGRGY